MVEHYNIVLNLILFYNSKTHNFIYSLFFRKNGGGLPNNRSKIWNLVNIKHDTHLMVFLVFKNKFVCLKILIILEPQTNSIYK